MKGSFFKSIVVVFLVASIFAGCASKSNWSIVNEFEVDSVMSNVGFISESAGFSAGTHGAVFYTSDGGQNWQPGNNASMCLYTIDVTDSGECVYGGNGGVVGISNDKGKNWSGFKQTIPTPAVLVSFYDINNGYAATRQNKIYRTNDGGQSWNEIKTPEVRRALALDSPAIDSLYLFDNKGKLYITGDNGNNWKSVDIFDGKVHLDLADHETNSACLRLTNSGSGSLAVIVPESDEKKRSVLLLTTDDGFNTHKAEYIKHGEVSYLTRVFLSADSRTLTLRNISKAVVFKKI